MRQIWKSNGFGDDHCLGGDGFGDGVLGRFGDGYGDGSSGIGHINGNGYDQDYGHRDDDLRRVYPSEFIGTLAVS